MVLNDYSRSKVENYTHTKYRKGLTTSDDVATRVVSIPVLKKKKANQTTILFVL